MLKIKQNYSLLKYNTFHIEESTKYFVEINNIKDIQIVLASAKLVNEPLIVIGKGANILLTKYFAGVVLQMNIKGRRIVKETKQEVFLELGAGEDWHQTVMYTVKKNWGGIENMALIPSSLGAAPIQNIAAYGQNFADIFYSLETIEISTGNRVVFTKKMCAFQYRGSVFKKQLMNKYIIIQVTIRLKKTPKLDTSYFETGQSYAKNISILNELKVIAQKPYTIKNIAQAVINIRTKKLPNIKKVGTAGSFFENPIVNINKLVELQKNMKNLQYYPVKDLHYNSLEEFDMNKCQNVKVPAGKLLDELGWKGKQIGRVGVHPQQALCVVNLGGATGKEILGFTKKMQQDCLQKYGIDLISEVVII